MVDPRLRKCDEKSNEKSLVSLHGDRLSRKGALLGMQMWRDKRSISLRVS